MNNQFVEVEFENPNLLVKVNISNIVYVYFIDSDTCGIKLNSESNVLMAKRNPHLDSILLGKE